MIDLKKLSGMWKDRGEKTQAKGAGSEGMTTLSFRIEGMSCSCEGQIVEKRVKAIAGVRDFSLNPITNLMRVVCDPTRVSVQDIEKAVVKAGVKAVPIQSK